MRYIYLLFGAFAFLLTYSAQAQSKFSHQGSIENWTSRPVVDPATGITEAIRFEFDGAVHGGLYPTLPVYVHQLNLNGPGTLDVRLTDASFERFEKSPAEDEALLEEEISINAEVAQQGRQYKGLISFVPIRKTGNLYERITSFTLSIDYQYRPTATPRTTNWPTTSALSQGQLFKIGIPTRGMYRITRDFLESELELDVSNIDPRQVQFFSMPGGPLPELNATDRPKDVEEMAVLAIGEGDGSLDQGDSFIFYANGPHSWSYDDLNQTFNRRANPYDTRQYVILRIGVENGKRVATVNGPSSTDVTVTNFDDYQQYEEETFNLLHESLSAEGSGQQFFGDLFSGTRERTFSDFSFPNLVEIEPVKVRTQMAVRSGSSSSYTISGAGQTYSSGNIGKVNLASSTADYAIVRALNEEFNFNSDQLSFSISYPAVGNATNEAWLDFIRVQATRGLIQTGPFMPFRKIESANVASSTYQVRGASAQTRVWDITNPTQPSRQSGNLSGGTFAFNANTNREIKEYISFQEDGSLLTPEAIGSIENSNIHGIQDVDMVIIYHPDFLEPAQRLAEHRSSFSQISVELVNVFGIMHEFAGGAWDAVAIRDFNKMLFERNPNFQFCLLFGDCSFDQRDIYGLGEIFTPVYETIESVDPIFAFPADDFFALLSDDEGFNLQGLQDITVGRLPVRSVQEADVVVNKIIKYDTNLNTLGDWRNRVSFVADDQDGNLHVRDADDISRKVEAEHPVLNINKIYCDAFPQVSTPGGARYPSVNEAINRDVFRGTLVMNYMGHGGPRGWAQERILTNNDIASWRNPNQLLVLVTATCSFTGYDDPSLTSAGEQTILLPNAGVVGLFTTTRAVYASSNRTLTEDVFEHMFDFENGQPKTFGQIMMDSKNQGIIGSSSPTGYTLNTRKFALIGDPSQRLALPPLQVVTTKINGNDIGNGVPDTIGALEQVTIEGQVLNPDGSIATDFNGKIFPTVFDKTTTVSTLGQDDNSSPRNFELQRNIIFKGAASVSGGTFGFSFIVPKDIDYTLDYGKISYYAENNTLVDARGYSTELVIGGAGQNSIVDDQPPLVEVFMNTESFVSGGTTDANPTLLVRLSDDYGINVAGNSIGHDLSGVLDEDVQNTYILNDFYEAQLDQPNRGTVRYPLFDLAEGLHRIDVKAYDVANNSGEGFTEFIVSATATDALENVLNYPNPFTTRTSFQFEHGLANQELDVRVQIFTVSGRLVKTIQQSVMPTGLRVTGIEWDGKDDYGDSLARGVYLYKVSVRPIGGDIAGSKTESDFERLVILK